MASQNLRSDPKAWLHGLAARYRADVRGENFAKPLLACHAAEWRVKENERLRMAGLMRQAKWPHLAKLLESDRFALHRDTLRPSWDEIAARDMPDRIQRLRNETDDELLVSLAVWTLHYAADSVLNPLHPRSVLVLVEALREFQNPNLARRLLKDVLWPLRQREPTRFDTALFEEMRIELALCTSLATDLPPGVRLDVAWSVLNVSESRADIHGLAAAHTVEEFDRAITQWTTAGDYPRLKCGASLFKRMWDLERRTEFLERTHLCYRAAYDILRQQVAEAPVKDAHVCAAVLSSGLETAFQGMVWKRLLPVIPESVAPGTGGRSSDDPVREALEALKQLLLAGCTENPDGYARAFDGFRNALAHIPRDGVTGGGAGEFKTVFDDIHDLMAEIDPGLQAGCAALLDEIRTETRRQDRDRALDTVRACIVASAAGEAASDPASEPMRALLRDIGTIDPSADGIAKVMDQAAAGDASEWNRVETLVATVSRLDPRPADLHAEVPATPLPRAQTVHDLQAHLCDCFRQPETRYRFLVNLAQLHFGIYGGQHGERHHLVAGKTFLGIAKDLEVAGEESRRIPRWLSDHKVRETVSRTAVLGVAPHDLHEFVEPKHLNGAGAEWLADTARSASVIKSLSGGKVGLALSGGGFRSSFFHLGVFACLAELNLLKHVEVLSCVSGGSVVGTHYYLKLRKLLGEKPRVFTTRALLEDLKSYMKELKRLRVLREFHRVEHLDRLAALRIPNDLPDGEVRARLERLVEASGEREPGWRDIVGGVARRLRFGRQAGRPGARRLLRDLERLRGLDLPAPADLDDGPRIELLRLKYKLRRYLGMLLRDAAVLDDATLAKETGLRDDLALYRDLVRHLEVYRKLVRVFGAANRNLDAASELLSVSEEELDRYPELRNRPEPHAECMGTLCTRHYIELVRELIDDFLGGVQQDIRTRVVAHPLQNLRMLFTGYTRSDRAGDLFERHLYRRVSDAEGRRGRPRLLKDMTITPYEFGLHGQGRSFNPSLYNWSREHKVPRLILNATSLNTGHNWQFTVKWMGESPAAIDTKVDANARLRRVRYDGGAPSPHNRLRLGRAVAASASVPGLFDPATLDGLYEDTEGKVVVRLVDGGVFDNQGVASLLEQECRVLLVSDASGQMDFKHDPSGGPLGVPLRANAILMERIRQTQFRDLAERLRSGQLRGLAFVHLKKELTGETLDWLRCDDPKREQERLAAASKPLTSYGVRRDYQRRLADIRTDLDSFCDAEAYALMYSGYRMMSKELEPHLVRVRDGEPGEGIDQLLEPPFHHPDPPWQFMCVEDVMTGVERDERFRRRFENVLSVANERMFRMWRLWWKGRVLKPALVVAFVALVVYGLWDASTHAGHAAEELGLGVHPLTWLNSLHWISGKIPRLSDDARAYLIGGLVLALVVGAVYPASVRMFAGKVQVLLLGSLGMVYSWIQLVVFDPLYKRYGRKAPAEREQRGLFRWLESKR